ncbi:MAG: hypothetical protein E7632_00305 [Ruminococcaceae bacterium]|nr:hypothetical protein [Oscillospiraceae bacterium]
MKKKTISAVLFLSMLLSAVSCAGGTDAPESSQISPDTTAAETTESVDARQMVEDELPKKNFNGTTFTILGEKSKEQFLDLEATTGDVVDDAIFERNRMVEERFGVELNIVTAPDHRTLVKQVSGNVQAGDDEYQLVSGHVVAFSASALNGELLNWYNIPNVDFSKPWWAKANIETLTYNGFCPLAIGDFALSALQNTYCVYANMRLAEDYGLPDVRETVLDGNWTIDEIIGLTKDIYQDVNSNAVEDQDDFYGWCINSSSSSNAFLWAFDNPIITNDPAEGLIVTYHSEKINDIVTKIVNMTKDNSGISFDLSYKNEAGDGAYAYPRDMFAQSKTVFAAGAISQSVSHFREMEDEYSILPYPKWDENQKSYMTMVDGSHSVLGVPVTVTDTEMVGIVTEALCAESYKQVVPAYYDVALKVKGARDEVSVQILDLLVENRVFDMGYVYDNWKGASFLLEILVSAGNTNFESTWASKKSAILAHYETVINYFKGE